MQQTDELFSALLDGELASDDIDALIKTLDDEPASGHAVTRWSSIGVMMRGQSRLPARFDLLEGVREAIATEAADQSDNVVSLASRQRSRRRRWALPATGLAAAASLALAAVVVPLAWQSESASESTGTTATVAASGLFAEDAAGQNSVAQAVPSSASTTVQSGNREVMTAFPAGDERLNTYYIEYAGHRSAQGIGGPLGYARYAAHNADLSHRAR